MKILIAYYSRTGHTENLVNVIKDRLQVRGHELEIEKIELEKEPSPWFLLALDMQIMVSFLIGLLVKKDFLPRRKIKQFLYSDISGFDRICIATPKWGSVSPAICQYLDRIKGLKGKKVGFAASYYSPPHPNLEIKMLFWKFKKMIENKNGKLVAMIGATTDFIEPGGKPYIPLGFIFNIIRYGKPFTPEWKERYAYLISPKWKAVPPYGAKAIEAFCDNLEGSELL